MKVLVSINMRSASSALQADRMAWLAKSGWHLGRPDWRKDRPSDRAGLLARSGAIPRIFLQDSQGPGSRGPAWADGLPGERRDDRGLWPSCRSSRVRRDGPQVLYRQ